MSKYICNFSTGLMSFEAARRAKEKYGAENIIVAFSDVKGDPSRDVHAAPAGTNWDGEDEDNYRFLDDAERLLGVPILRLSHPEGLGVWGAIFQARAIAIRGQAMTFAPCTKRLKMEVMDAFVTSIRGRESVVQVLGLGWGEMDRIEKFRERVDSDVEFPLLDEPHVQNCDIIKYLRENGVEPPRAYEQGYPHANCGGACIKAGQQQWAALLRDNPGRYRYNEEQEDWFRRDINPGVSILRDRRGGTTKALPLKQFREEIESGQRVPTPFDWGGCACFTASMEIELEAA